jgi:hypothetical protein
MCITTFKRIVFLCFACPYFAFALDLGQHEETCLNLGFKKRTSSFGECVLELDQRESILRKKAQKSSGEVQRNIKVEPETTGNESPDQLLCLKYGFTPQTNGYSQCRMQIDLARKQAEDNQRIYENKLADQEKEKSKRQGEAWMMLGLGLLSGSQRTLPSGGFEQLQPPGGIRNYTLPNGRMLTCSTVGTSTNCF